MNRGRRKSILILLAAALSLLPYVGTLDHGFVWDDHELIGNNRALLGHPLPSLLQPFTLGAEKSSYYRPVVILSLALDHSLWGLEPRGYHLTNLVIYALSTIGLSLLLLGPVSWAAAALAVALFALHPTHVESVAFISGRSDLLAGFFLVGTMLLIKEAICDPRRGRIGLLVLAGLSYLLSLLSKESAGHLPLFALAALWMLRRDEAARNVALKVAISIFAGFVAYLALRFASLQGTSVSSAASLQVFPLHDYPWFFHQFFRLLFVPYQLLPYYEATRPSIATYAALALWVAALAFVIRWLVGKGNRGIFGMGSVMWLFLAILPVLPLFRQSGAIIADRFLYVPSIGLVAVVAAGTDLLLSRFRDGWQRFLPTVLILVALAMGFVTGTRAQEWRSDLSLFESAALRAPRSIVLNYLLGKEYLKQRRLDEATRSLRKALELAPDYVRARVSLGDAHRFRGEIQQAEREYRLALVAKPGDAEAAFGLGTIAMDRGDVASARASFRLALAQDPGLAAAHLNLGNLSYQEGDYGAAEQSWLKVLGMNPTNTQAMNNLGVLAKGRGNVAAARDLFRRALDVDPGYSDARRNLENLERLVPR